MKRLFIGIPVISGKAVQATETWRHNELLNHNVLKWVIPENWHITLIFLGNIDESEVPQIQKLIKESFSKIPSFEAELKGLGVFPGPNKPKVLWLGIENIQPLLPAQFHLVRLMKQSGFRLDNKPLKPHLTLARIKNSAHRIAINSLVDQFQEFDFGSVVIDRVILFESISTPHGPVYKPLFVKELV